MKNKPFKECELRGEKLWLFPQKVMYWQRRKLLVVSDLHLGKSAHFRIHGIAVPKSINDKNIENLDTLLNMLDVEILLFLGDLFHSDSNKEVNEFKAWRNKYPGINMYLTLGNHDILDTSFYDEMEVNCIHKLEAAPFLFLHDTNDLSKQDSATGLYPIAGHIHPAVKLKGKGRQSATFPCFYFGIRHGLMPAFGSFTGTHIVRPAEGDQIYTIVEDKILEYH